MKWIVLLLALLHGPALACSMAPGYRTPTNLELIADADIVVVATVIDGPTGFAAGSPPDESAVRLQPIRFLKGATDVPLSVDGVIALNGQAVPPIVTSLSESHFSSGMGACVRILYARGTPLVAMFKMVDGKPQQLFAAFARIAEDVEGPDDLWPRIAARYVALAAGGDGTLAERARRLRGDLAKEAGIEAAAMQADLDRYLERDADVPRWTTATGPLDAAATLWAGRGRRSAGLVCDSTGLALVAGAPAGTPPATTLALRAGERTWTADAPAPMPGGGVGTRRAIVRDPTLLPALLTVTGPVTVLVDGEPIGEAPPGDALYRLARGCGAASRSSTAPPARP